MPLLMVRVLRQDWAPLHGAGMEWGGCEMRVQKYPQRSDMQADCGMKRVTRA